MIKSLVLDFKTFELRLDLRLLSFLKSSHHLSVIFLRLASFFHPLDVPRLCKFFINSNLNLLRFYFFRKLNMSPNEGTVLIATPEWFNDLEEV